MIEKSALIADLRATAPRALAAARDAGHKAAQLPARAAIANLEPRPDWSHSSLSWDAASGALVSEPLPMAGGARVALALSPLRLEWRGATATETLSLRASSAADALAWLDARLEAVGVQKASATPESDGLPAAVAELEGFGGDALDGALASLGAWYALSAEALERFAAAHGDIQPGPTKVLCWPHHFDIATLVRLSDSEDEDAPAVGCGMAPGDAAYDQPYIYVNPWPHLDAAAPLPDLPIGRWHREGFVGAVATGEDVVREENPVAALDAFLSRAFELGRAAMG